MRMSSRSSAVSSSGSGIGSICIGMLGPQSAGDCVLVGSQLKNPSLNSPQRLRGNRLSFIEERQKRFVIRL